MCLIEYHMLDIKHTCYGNKKGGMSFTAIKLLNQLVNKTKLN